MRGICGARKGDQHGNPSADFLGHVGDKNRKNPSFFACVWTSFSDKTGLFGLKFIGGIKIVIDGATQL